MNSPSARHAFAGTATVVVLSATVLLTFARLGSGEKYHAQRGAIATFKGVTSNDTVRTGLYSVRSSGVTTAPVKAAAERFLAVLSDSQRARTTFPIGHDEWRNWNNVHRAARQGVSYKEMSDVQRVRATELLRASLSAKGLEKSLNVMRLNETIAEMTGRRDEYGEGLYHLTVMGIPSEKDPWGWQLEGHHLIVNYFVLGDQVVMTPTFMGSEPVVATSGKYRGVEVLQEEQRLGLMLMRSLSSGQQQKALLGPAKTSNDAQGQAGRDNLVLEYAGIRASELSTAQRQQLLALITEYVSNMDAGHARVRVSEVRDHLDETHFAWKGGVSDTSVFYYRVHSPVILIEFDHQLPVALPGPRVPGRDHIHTVVRTPNGNDYGKDLLRQHYEANKGNPDHAHGAIPR